MYLFSALFLTHLPEVAIHLFLFWPSTCTCSLALPGRVSEPASWPWQQHHHVGARALKGLGHCCDLGKFLTMLKHRKPTFSFCAVPWKAIGWQKWKNRGRATVRNSKMKAERVMLSSRFREFRVGVPGKIGASWWWHLGKLENCAAEETGYRKVVFAEEFFPLILLDRDCWGCRRNVLNTKVRSSRQHVKDTVSPD